MAFNTVQYKCASESLLESILLSKATRYIIKEFLFKIVYSNGFNVDYQI